MSTPVSIITDAWYEAIHMNPEWRRGQALFNVIWQYNNDYGRELLESTVNPYYDDSKIGDTFAWLTERLEY